MMGLSSAGTLSSIANKQLLLKQLKTCQDSKLALYFSRVQESVQEKLKTIKWQSEGCLLCVMRLLGLLCAIVTSFGLKIGTTSACTQCQKEESA